MIRTELTTLIDRPAQVVFDYVVDFETLPRKTSDGPIGIGSTWTHERKQGPQKIVAPIELVECVPPRHFVMVSGAGGFAVRSTMTFEEAGPRSTRVTEVLEMKTKGVTRLFEPLIRRQVPKQGAAVHERMKQVIEAQR